MSGPLPCNGIPLEAVRSPNTVKRSASQVSVSSSLSPAQQDQWKTERINSQVIDAVISGKSEKDLAELFKGRSHIWNAVCCATGTSVLHLAALLGNEELIIQIATKEGCMTHCDHMGRSALHLAAWNGHLASLKTLLGRGCKEIIDAQTDEEKAPEDRKTIPLEWGDSFYHNHNAIKNLLPELPVGSTALHVAFIRGHVECIQILTWEGASVNIPDCRGRLAFDVLGENVDVKGPSARSENSLPRRRSGRSPKDTQNTYHCVKSAYDLREAADSAPKIRAFAYVGEEPEFTTETEDTSEEDERDEEEEVEESVSFARIAERLTAGVQLLRLLDLNRAAVPTQSSEALHNAVAMGLEVLVDFHATRGVDYKSYNLEGDTIIFVALKKQNWTMLEKLLNMFPELVNLPNKAGDYPLHAAIFLYSVFSSAASEGVAILLEYGANPFALNSIGATVLHIACTVNYTDMLRELLNSSSEMLQLLKVRDEAGKMPLHCAVEGDSKEAWTMLVEAGADVDAMTYQRQSVLHLAVLWNRDDMLSVILDSIGEGPLFSEIVNARDCNGLTPLLMAVRDGNSEAVELLLNAGADNSLLLEDDRSGPGSSSLHVAASRGHEAIVSLITENCPELLHQLNHNGWPPVYVAARFGKRNVVRVLLSHGADLASTVQDGNRRRSTMNEIVRNIRHPGALLRDVLDSKICKNSYLVSHPEAVVTVKYDILIPQIDNNDDDELIGRQMRVLDAFLNSGGGKDVEKLISHPLIRSFLQKRWTALAPCYWLLVFLHLLMVAAHTTLVTQAMWGKADSQLAQISRITLIGAALVIAFEEVIRASQVFRLYITDGETWLKWLSLLLIFYVALENSEYIQATGPPKAAEQSSDEPTNIAEVLVQRRVFVRHIVALSVLTTWVELLLILSRIPTWGLRVQMFYKVAVSVVKVMLTFSILLIAFSFAFMVQFNGKPAFQTILGSFGQTLVMMTSEFNYSDIFDDNDGVMSRIPFFLFLLFVSIVLMNLLVGLAVSDIAYLEDEGRRRCLEQQAAFLSSLENIIYSLPVRKLLPQRVLASFNRHVSVTPEIEFFPATPKRQYRISRLQALPEELQEELIKIAIQNSSNSYN